MLTFFISFKSQSPNPFLIVRNIGNLEVTLIKDIPDRNRENYHTLRENIFKTSKLIKGCYDAHTLGDLILYSYQISLRFAYM